MHIPFHGPCCHPSFLFTNENQIEEDVLGDGRCSGQVEGAHNCFAFWGPELAERTNPHRTKG